MSRSSHHPTKLAPDHPPHPLLAVSRGRRWREMPQMRRLLPQQLLSCLCTRRAPAAMRGMACDAWHVSLFSELRCSMSHVAHRTLHVLGRAECTLRVLLYAPCGTRRAAGRAHVTAHHQSPNRWRDALLRGRRLQLRRRQLLRRRRQLPQRLLRCLHSRRAPLHGAWCAMHAARVTYPPQREPHGPARATC